MGKALARCARCAASLVALRALRYHDLPLGQQEEVALAITMSTLLYAAPACWGLTPRVKDCLGWKIQRAIETMGVPL